MSLAPDGTLFPEHLRADESAGVFVLLHDILAAVEACYDDTHVPLPERRLVAASTQPVDCEQLVVSFGQLYLGLPGDEAQQPVRCDSAMTVVAEVALTRCVAKPSASRTMVRAATPEHLAESAQLVLRDAFLLLACGRYMDFWDPFGPGMGVIATVDVADPTGGYQTTTLTITGALP